MKILFFMQSPDYIEQYYDITQRLLKQGHHIHLLFYLSTKQQFGHEIPEALHQEFPDNFSFGKALKRRDMWGGFVTVLAWGTDYLHYLVIKKNYAQLQFSREQKVSNKLRWLVTKCPLANTQPVIRILRWLFRHIYNHLVPNSKTITQLIKEQRPDILIVTPLVIQGSLQGEYLRAATERGIKSVYCVAAEDDLNSKGMIRGMPDKVIVQNEAQKQQAVKWHKIKAKDISIVETSDAFINTLQDLYRHPTKPKRRFFWGKFMDTLLLPFAMQARSEKEIQQQKHERYIATQVWKKRILLSFRRPHLIREPLILISQIQRSGGTLLSQLLDDHPQLYVHPSELQLGKKKNVWVRLALEDSPKEWFSAIKEQRMQRFVQNGYSKFSSASPSEPDTFDFHFDFNTLQINFEALATKYSPQSSREIIDIYITSFFSAWKDYQRPKDEETRYWAAFAATFSSNPKEVDMFFNDYPDGYLVCSFRNPVSWFASASRHKPEVFGKPETGMKEWEQSMIGIRENMQRHPGRVLLICFENLVSDTEGEMKRLCQFCNLDFDQSMLTPTFNGKAIQADSSFAVENKGIIKSVLDRSKFVSDDAKQYIETSYLKLYEEFKSLSI